MSKKEKSSTPDKQPAIETSASLKSHPSLKYFSAGGAIGKEYLVVVLARHPNELRQRGGKSTIERLARLHFLFVSRAADIETVLPNLGYDNGGEFRKSMAVPLSK